MSEDKKQDRRFQEVLSYREHLNKNMDYSIQRIDWLIIALSSSGIVLVTGVLADNPNSIFLKIAVGCFSASMVLNLISQYSAYYIHRKLVVLYDKKISDMIDQPDTEKSYQEEDKLHSKGKWIDRMNVISFLLFAAGVACYLLYYWRR